MYNIFARIVLFAVSSTLWISRSRKNVCYKKYLGPDWEPDFDGRAGTTVSNHQSFVDIFIHAMYQIPAFVMKKKSLKFPFLKQLALIG
jgi:1-acyl-sn-glycerol-3-phosphate acyltransferase